MAEAERPWVLPGIELSCEVTGRTIGVLGIGMNVRDAALSDFLKREEAIDAAELQGWSDAIQERLGVDIGRVFAQWMDQTLPDFADRHHRYVPEWARKRLLLEAGLVDNGSEARLLHQSIMSALPVRQLPSACDVIGHVHRAGGLAFLEHPPQEFDESHAEELSGNGLDGIEVYSGYVDDASRARWSEFCSCHALLAVAGSDHHGLRGQWGRIGRPCPHPAELTLRLLERVESSTDWGTAHPETCLAIRGALS